MAEGRVVSGRRSEMARSRLCLAGIRPTRPRLQLAALLFGTTHRHVDASVLFAEAQDAGARVSLATVYNTLGEFEKAGLVRRIAVAGERRWYDTDVGDHRHFYVEAENRVIDVPAGPGAPGEVPVPPEGYRVAKVDLVVHLVRVDGWRPEPSDRSDTDG